MMGVSDTFFGYMFDFCSNDVKFEIYVLMLYKLYVVSEFCYSITSPYTQLMSQNTETSDKGVPEWKQKRPAIIDKSKPKKQKYTINWILLVILFIASILFSFVQVPSPYRQILKVSR